MVVVWKLPTTIYALRIGDVHTYEGRCCFITILNDMNVTKNLIKITQHQGKQAVSAKELHAFLESKKDFSSWIKDRIKKYGLVENEYFVVFTNLGENPNGGRPLTEYAPVEKEMKELKAKSTTHPDYFTIAGYGSLHGIMVNLKQASSLGRKASELCKRLGIQTDECPDPRFGKVKMYPSEVLEKVFSMPIN